MSQVCTKAETNVLFEFRISSIQSLQTVFIQIVQPFITVGWAYVVTLAATGSQTEGESRWEFMDGPLPIDRHGNSLYSIIARNWRPSHRRFTCFSNFVHNKYFFFGQCQISCGRCPSFPVLLQACLLRNPPMFIHTYTVLHKAWNATCWNLYDVDVL